MEKATWIRFQVILPRPRDHKQGKSQPYGMPMCRHHTYSYYTVLKCPQKSKLQLASFFFFFLRRLLPEESDSDSLLDSCPSTQIVHWKQPGCIWHLQNGWKALEVRTALANFTCTYSSLGSVKRKQASAWSCMKNSSDKAPFLLIHRTQPNWILGNRCVVISWMRDR